MMEIRADIPALDARVRAIEVGFAASTSGSPRSHGCTCRSNDAHACGLQCGNGPADRTATACYRWRLRARSRSWSKTTRNYVK